MGVATWHYRGSITLACAISLLSAAGCLDPQQGDSLFSPQVYRISTTSPTNGDNTHLVFSKQPPSTSVNTDFTVIVQVRTPIGNTDKAASSAITLSLKDNSAGGHLFGNLSGKLEVGTLTFSHLSIDKAGSGFTIQAVSSEFGTAVSNSFDITSGNQTIPAQAPLVYNTDSSNSCQPINASGDLLDYQFSNCPLRVHNGAVDAGADQTTQIAFQNMQAVFEFYRTQLQRNSYDNEGSSLRGMVHVGTNYPNAFWLPLSIGDSSDDPIFNMAYFGDGNSTYASFSSVIDIVGHEVTHGVTGVAINLPYYSEYGALDEGLADYFGELVKITTKSLDYRSVSSWDQGAGIYKSDSSIGLRNIALPSKYSDYPGAETTKTPYPSRESEKFQDTGTCDENNDYCSVHFNSTVISHLFYSINYAIGTTNAEKLIYIVLNHYLTASSNFADTRTQLAAACVQLYGSGSDTCDQVNAAIEANQL